MSLIEIMREMDEQIRTVDRHAAAEGVEVETSTTLESYDRTLHPWIHGRRPADLVGRVRGWWD